MCPNIQEEFDYEMNEFMLPEEDQIFDDVLEDDSTTSALDFVMLRECSIVTRISPPMTKIRECRIQSLTGGSVIITNINDEVVDKSPRIEILRSDDSRKNNKLLFQYELDQTDNMDHDFDSAEIDLSNNLPSGCQELPGWRFNSYDNASNSQAATSRGCQTKSVGTQKNLEDGTSDSSQEIRVSATVQLPANMNQCSVNITATRGPLTTPSAMPLQATRSRSPPPPYSFESTGPSLYRGCSNNFNGGGIVNLLPSAPPMAMNSEAVHDAIMQRLRYGGYKTRGSNDIRRDLEICDFFYENISWQESTEILKNAPQGRWILRNSRNQRYNYAISVQTSTGPTSIRINCNMGQFRLDADSNLTFEVPFFTCIFELIKYYIEYSKVMDSNRRVVWVDYSRRLYNQIYLSERPLYKKVSNLTHLARLCINKNRLPTYKLPSSLQEYCQEYPFSF